MILFSIQKFYTNKIKNKLIMKAK